MNVIVITRAGQLHLVLSIIIRVLLVVGLLYINRTEQNRTLYFDREVSVHIYKYIHIQNSYASSNRTLLIK